MVKWSFDTACRFDVVEPESEEDSSGYKDYHPRIRASFNKTSNGCFWIHPRTFVTVFSAKKFAAAIVKKFNKQLEMHGYLLTEKEMQDASD